MSHYIRAKKNETLEEKVVRLDEMMVVILQNFENMNEIMAASEREHIAGIKELQNQMLTAIVKLHWKEERIRAIEREVEALKKAVNAKAAGDMSGFNIDRAQFRAYCDRE
jgi:hypothetical protein